MVGLFFHGRSSLRHHHWPLDCLTASVRQRPWWRTLSCTKTPRMAASSMSRWVASVVNIMNVSPWFEWQTAISQSAWVDKTHHFSDCQFYPAVQNCFLTMIFCSLKSSGRLYTSGIEERFQTYWCCHTFVRPYIWKILSAGKTLLWYRGWMLKEYVCRLPSMHVCGKHRHRRRCCHT